MKKIAICFFSLILSVIASAKTEVQMKTSIEVSRAIVLQLEDIVILKNQTPDTIRSVLDMDLPFHKETISKLEILDWMKKAMEERPDLRHLSFIIPEQIHITETVGLSKLQIQERLENRLTLKCSDCRFRVSISNLPEIHVSTVSLEWRDIPTSGAFMLPVMSTDGQNLSWISGQIKAQRQVVKTARVLRIGDTLVDSDLTLDTMDVTFSKDFYTKKKDIVGKKVSRYIMTGTMLSSQDIQRDYAVRQGQMVKAVTGNESFEVSLPTMAQESGIVGDVIRIRNLSNQKMMSGRIMDKGIVRIE